MQFVSQTSGTITLGTMYTAEASGGYPTEYSCVPPDLLPPDKPTNVTAEAHASGGMLVQFDQDGPGGDPTYYTYEAENENFRSRTGRVVDVDGNDDISSPFLIIADPPFSQDAGQWRIKITAVNAAGEATSDSSNYITPSVEEPPVPDAPVITGVTTGNGTATVNFTAPNDNGEAITNYAYRLTREFDNDGDFEPLNPASTASSIALTDLNNGETYSVSIAAINANGTGPDSNVVEFTPGTQCEDVTNWTAPANTMGYFCSVGLNDYAYADFHILTTDGTTDVCDKLPTEENNNQGLFCASQGNTFRAIYDWDNSSRNIKLKWLNTVEQIGSRSGVGCGAAGATEADRCANQLVSGEGAFRSMAGVGGPGIGGLDTGNLVSMASMFDSAQAFNENIGDWNTSSVTDMAGMFASAEAFNQNIGGWNTSSVTNMSIMFNNALAFDQNIGSWDTSKVINMSLMFFGAQAFNQDLNDWKTGQVKDMSGMFFRANTFNGDISLWDTANVTDMSQMFQYAEAFDGNIGAWETANVTKMPLMFQFAYAFNQNIAGWDTGLVDNMVQMFFHAESFNQDLSTWDVEAVENHNGFDEGADAWCGLGFKNQGRPSDWEASAAGCRLNLDVTTEPLEVVETGSTVLYTATFGNDSNTDVANATLTFDLPSGTTVNSGFTPIAPDAESATQLTWTGLTIPKGSKGGQLLIGIDVPLSFAGDTLTANTTLAVTGASADKVTTLKVTPGGEPAFAATLDAPNYALAGTALTYELSVANTGTRDADNATVTLTWDQTELVPESSGGNCSGSPLTCSWDVSLAADDEGGWDTSLTVKVPDAAAFGDVISAQLSVSDVGSDATGGAFATTTVDAQPDLALVLTSSPRRVVAPGAEVEMTLALKNVGTAPAKNVVLTLPTDTATFASATGGGSANGDDVVWPPIASLTVSDTATTFTAKLTAGADDSVIQTQASVAGTTEGGASVSETSNLITLRVANEADPVLTAAFDPENFVPGKDIALTFKVANEGSALLNAGTLVVPLPKDTTVATEPAGATCDATACTIPVAALAAGASSTASVALTVDAGSRLTRLAGAGTLNPDTAGAFIAQSATAEADLQKTSDIKEPYEITIDPPAGLGCSLTSVSTQQDTGVSGFTLVRDELLNFSISGCETGTAVPVAITVQGDPLPEGTVAIKTDDSGASGTQITGATITGNTVSYTLTDNGSLDLDPTDGELRDPVAVAIVGGSGIYVPFVPVPIPYWALALLSGLMGWLGYRRLRLAW